MAVNNRNKDIKDLRYYAIWDKENKCYLMTHKGKNHWVSRPALKTAIHFHTGKYWNEVKNMYEIHELEFKRVKDNTKYMSTMYRKHFGLK